MNIRTLPIPAKKFVRLFGLAHFLHYFTFFWLIQNVYFVEHGLDYTKLSILLAVWSAVIIVLEVPSGALADKYSRKLLVIAGYAAFAISLVIFLFFPTFLGFIIGLVFWGIRDAATSGSEEAWLFDTLKEHKAEHEFSNALSFINVSRNVGLGTGMVVAGFVTSVSMTLNVQLSILIAVVSLLVVLGMKESKLHSSTQETKYFQYMVSAFKQARNNFEIIRVIAYSVTVLVGYLVITEYFIISLKEVNFLFTAIGFLAAIEAVFYVFGGWLVKPISKFRVQSVFVMLTLISVVLYTLIATGSQWLVVIGFLLLRVIRALNDTIPMDILQKQVQGHERATVASVRSLFMNSVYVLAALGFGIAADAIQLFPAFLIVAAFTGLYIVFHLFAYARSKV